MYIICIYIYMLTPPEPIKTTFPLIFTKKHTLFWSITLQQVFLIFFDGILTCMCCSNIVRVGQT